MEKNINNEEGFLPNGYEPPKGSSAYMRFEQGANKFLILCSALIGWEYWNVEGKPVRVKEEPKVTPKDIKLDEDGEPTKVKHFWSFAVWNYESKKVQILELTQSTIMREINALVKNEDWGTPIQTYAITISKEGEKLTTKYTITPSPAKDLPAEVGKAWEEVQKKGFDLTRLFEGGNPFSDEEKKAEAEYNRT